MRTNLSKKIITVHSNTPIFNLVGWRRLELHAVLFYRQSDIPCASSHLRINVTPTLNFLSKRESRNCLAIPTGFEPAISSVTERHHTPICCGIILKNLLVEEAGIEPANRRLQTPNA